MRSFSIVVCITISVLSPQLAGAQNLESIGKDKPITLTGGASVNQIFYSVNGIESRRDPYSYYASGNVNISIFGWSVPLSFSASNQNARFQQPFNQSFIDDDYQIMIFY